MALPEPIPASHRFLHGISSRVGTKKAVKISLFEFVQEAWSLVVPETYQDNWHVEAICRHLQAVTEGDIKNLVINVGPRLAKSFVMGVFWPAWEWGPGDLPKSQFLFSSHSQRLATRDSVYCRRVIESAWYQERFGHLFRLKYDQNEKNHFANDRSGYRLALALEGKVTGLGGDRVCVDDPHDIKDRHSQVRLRAQVDAWNSVMSNRVNDPMNSALVVSGHRIAENDLTASCLEQGYEHLCIPSEYDPERKSMTKRLNYPKEIFWEDPRNVEGELIFPGRYPEEVLQKEKIRSAAVYEAIHQQHPTVAEGDEIKRVWWNYWHYEGQTPQPVAVRTAEGYIYKKSVALPDLKKFRFLAQSWDLAFKDLDDSSYVVGQVWGLYDQNSFLLHQVRERLSFTNTIQAILGVTQAYPSATMKLIEDKANGPAVMDHLRNRIAGMIPVKVKDSKLGRARAVSPIVESGNIYLPHPSIQAPTTDDFVNEWAGIPDPKHWDQIDAGSQYMSRVYRGGGRKQWLTWGRQH